MQCAKLLLTFYNAHMYNQLSIPMGSLIYSPIYLYVYIYIYLSFFSTGIFLLHIDMYINTFVCKYLYVSYDDQCNIVPAGKMSACTLIIRFLYYTTAISTTTMVIIILSICRYSTSDCKPYICIYIYI